MKKNEFLAALGMSSAAVILTTCLGCSKNSGGTVAPIQSTVEPGLYIRPDLVSFNEDGTVITGPANCSVIIYKTQLKVSSLRIYA